MFRKILQIWEEFNNVDLTGFKTKSCLLPEIIKLLLKKRSFLAKRCWKSPNTWPLDSHVVMKLGWSCFSINSINLSSGGKWPAATGNGICKIGWMLKIFTWTIFYPLDGLLFCCIATSVIPVSQNSYRKRSLSSAQKFELAHVCLLCLETKVARIWVQFGEMVIRK